MAPQQQHYTLLADQLLGNVVDSGTMQLSSILGVGAFGALFRGHVVSTNHPSLPPLPADRTYAIKCIMISNAAAAIDNSRYAFSEFRLHTKCSAHPNVVTLHRVVRENNLIYLIMDYYEDGDLFNMITEKQVYLGRTEHVRHAIIQVIDALQYCHANGVYHRDLKPENILCRNNRATNMPHIVLADFGLASDQDVCWDSGVGSMYYMSPECQGDGQPKNRHNRFRATPYSPALHDVWSLGVLMINLSCGRNPWKKASVDDNTFASYLRKPASFLMDILPISRELNDILRMIFVPEADRISLQELRQKILNVKRFTLTAREFDSASSIVRAAAGSVLIARTQAEEAILGISNHPKTLLDDEDDVRSLLYASWPSVPTSGDDSVDGQGSSDDNMVGFIATTSSSDSSVEDVTNVAASEYDIAQYAKFYNHLDAQNPSSLLPAAKLRVTNPEEPLESGYRDENVIDLDDDDVSRCPSGSMSHSSSDRSPSIGSTLDYPLTPECGPLNSPNNVRWVSPSASPVESHAQLPSPVSLPTERGILSKAAKYMSSVDITRRTHRRTRSRTLTTEVGSHYYSSAVAGAGAITAAQHFSPIHQKKHQRNSFIRSLIKSQ